MKKPILLFLVALLIAQPGFATLQSIGGVIFWPAPFPSNTNRLLNASILQIALNEQADLACAVKQIPKAGDIAKVFWKTGTVTTANDLKAGIYTVDATTGHATTTAYKGMAAGTVVAGSVTATTYIPFVLGTNATSVVQGDVVGACVQSADADAINLQIMTGDAANWQGLLPYIDSYDNATTTWTKAVGSPLVTFEYSDGSYAEVVGTFPVSAATDTAYNTGAANDEGGNNITLPFKCRAAGFWFYGDVNTDITFKLYDTDGATVLASFAFDFDIQQASTTGIKYVRFASGITLTTNSTYKLTMLTASATSSTMSDVTVLAAAQMGAMPGGQTISYTTRDGGGAWTNTATKRAMIGLLIDQLDDGASAGGTRVY